MKFLHLADLHLGRRLCDAPLLEDQRHILGEILEIARRESVDAVLIAGDVYDKSVPPVEAVALLDIALLRSQACEQGISEIKQQDGRLLLTFAETDFARLSALCGDDTFRGRLLLNAGSSPYLSLRLNKGEQPLDMAETLVEKYAATA